MWGKIMKAKCSIAKFLEVINEIIDRARMIQYATAIRQTSPGANRKLFIASLQFS